ncbi:cob(I)yrinic acid a,c-diamide adenosyltransferase [Vagococcus sp. BWB3-3]|uniref:Corrinoid adenosyltransferase n=1 Tax=Vagococcus allomyrinae TaxID=2794353 RepID=A0A940P9Y2_9ENTE|nr:cob(I)yrinic acid a,c-diamide adenosyltransferase [Vagococcus allomyrinae]MBP1040840.1 cob(I)yrinic acid a,c-diamide adenosyltransferase [Vagococcus allomyrinae]
MKIYTKTGDKGDTSIIGGEKVKKCANRVVAYGTTDELNSHIGVIISQMKSSPDIKKDLLEIQQILFDCGTDLATPNSSKGFRTNEEPTLWLESCIDKYLASPPDIQEFILPGGDPIASQLHVARTIARRAERYVVATSLEEEINADVLTFLNRLSDYFFAAARLVNFREGRPDISYRRNSQVFYN